MPCYKQFAELNPVVLPATETKTIDMLRNYQFGRIQEAIGTTTFSNIIIAGHHPIRQLKLKDKIDKLFTDIADCDVLLNPETYIKAENKILNENFDLVYPYGFEQNDQRLIPNTTEHRYNLNISNPSLYKTALCRYGHVQFFKTKSYRQGFMENEHYRHWCPEDVERCIRFQKLGYNVCWMPGTLIFHLEHPPSFKEPFVNKYEIMKLHNFLISLSKEKLYEYYKNQLYLKNYKNE